MSEDLAVVISGLRKSYGATTVLDGIDLEVAAGTVFALLGPNGAGKTTMIKILSTLVRADAGRATVAGFDVVHDRRQVRRAISLTGQFAALDELQTGRENLHMMGRLAGLDRPTAARRSEELLTRFDLVEAADRRVKTYSGGMGRRLDLAVGLVGRPSVIFLDEPTTGLDLRSRQQTWQIVEDLVGDGTTVFLTTQYLEEADRLAGRIAVLDAGRVVATGTPAELKQRYAQQRLDLVAADRDTYERLASELDGRTVHSEPSLLTLGVPTDGSAAHVRRFLDEVDPTGALVSRFSVHTATLDDVFLALTGHVASTEEKELAHV